MRIEKELDGFIICRGRARESFFCFFVDADRSCWTSKSPWIATKYKSEADARKAVKELKRRERLRRSC